MQLRAGPEVAFSDADPGEDDEVLADVARRMLGGERRIASVQAAIEPKDPVVHPLAKQLTEMLIAEFGKTSLSGIYLPDPPIRGPFGEGEIWLKPDAKPVSVPPFRLSGEREEALRNLVGKSMDLHKLEPGKGAWNTPAFPVPKKGSQRQPRCNPRGRLGSCLDELLLQTSLNPGNCFAEQLSE